MVETSNCPTCGYPRTFATGRCTRCGYQFSDAGVVADSVADGFIADQPAASGPAELSQSVPVAEGLLMCLNHPSVLASARCDYCGVNICSVCDFPISPPPSSESILNIGRTAHACSSCVNTGGSSRLPHGLPQQTLPLPGGVMCSQHPEANAVRRCGLCTATMCPTCDFEFPGHFHLCPTCATNPQTALSSRRKKLIGFAYALAAWATLALAVLFSGALAGLVEQSKEAEAAIGVLAGIGIFIPTLAGTALSFSALDKRLGNPPAIWGAVIWNAVLLAMWVVLSVVGSLS